MCRCRGVMPMPGSVTIATGWGRLSISGTGLFWSCMTGGPSSASTGPAATFMTTPAVVRQRLKLASVSPALHEIYAEDGMTLDQLMAFSVSADHARQEQVWEPLAHSWNKEPDRKSTGLNSSH